jgi:hydrogenase maturation protease
MSIAALLVDAVQSSHPPGTIHRLDEEELAAFTSDAKSAHGWGVAETLKLGGQLTNSRPKIRVIGITAGELEMGAEMSDAVRDAIPSVCEAIEEEVKVLLK